MAASNPPIKNRAFSVFIALFDSDGAVVTSPTIAAGDFKIIDTAETGVENPDTTPSAFIAGSGIVKVDLTATEMNHDLQVIRWIDASGAEWVDGMLSIQTLSDAYAPVNTVQVEGADATDTIDTVVDGAISNAALATAANLATTDGKVDSILADTNELQTDDVPGLIAALDDLDSTEAQAAAAAALAAYDAATGTDVTTQATNILAKLLAYVQLLARSDSDVTTGRATELSEINFNFGSGAGDFSNQTESVEALRDRGDAAWDTADVSGLATAAALATTDGKVDSILTDTNELQTDDVPGLIAALENLSAADVNAQVLDVLNVDTFAEPTSVPAATASLVAKIGWLMKLARNRITQTATTQTVYDDDATTAAATSSVSDNGTTFERGEWT